jgi:fructokinase
MNDKVPLLGAIEAGGTKFNCAVGYGGSVLAQLRVPTTDPARTLAAALDFFRAQRVAHGPIHAFGLASFGPIELNRAAANYGSVLATPKPHWSHAPLVKPLAAELGCPVGFDTDVNAAALAELRWGAGRGLASLAYITVGTGIGVGVIVNGQCVHGLLHPEAGHIYPRRHPGDTGFAGSCPFHGDCLEGLASGPAIAARTGRPAETLGAAHPQWAFVADALGQLCAQLVLIHMPERIVLGGGVMAQAGLIEQVRARMLHWIGGYIKRPALENGAASYVVSPGLGERSGLMGAFALAAAAL